MAKKGDSSCTLRNTSQLTTYAYLQPRDGRVDLCREKNKNKESDDARHCQYTESKTLSTQIITSQ